MITETLQVWANDAQSSTFGLLRGISVLKNLTLCDTWVQSAYFSSPENEANSSYSLQSVSHPQNYTFCPLRLMLTAKYVWTVTERVNTLISAAGTWIRCVLTRPVRVKKYIYIYLSRNWKDQMVQKRPHDDLAKGTNKHPSFSHHPPSRFHCY